MAACDACGAAVDYGARFCGSCGAVVPARTEEWVSDRNKAKAVTAKQRVPKRKAAAKDGELRSTIRGVAGSTAHSAVAVPPAAESSESSSPPPEPKEASEERDVTNDTIRPPPPPTEITELDAGPRSEFQRLLDEVETGFDAILVTGEPTPAPANQTPSQDTSKNVFDEAQAKGLFDDLVVANAQPIRDFMIEVRLGEPHGAWVDSCRPAMRAILRSAQGMGYSELVGKLQRFVDALDAAKPEGDKQEAVRGERRERLIDGYSELIAFFPEAFALETESNQREALLVRSLLSKVEGLNRLALDRIYETGMASLGLFYVSRDKDIAEFAGIPLAIAGRIVAQFREYRQLVSETSPERGRTIERKRLRTLTEELMRLSQAYDASSAGTATRRELRRARGLVVADINLVLARLGQVERANEFEKLAFHQRVQALLSFLEEAERKALAEQAVR